MLLRHTEFRHEGAIYTFTNELKVDESAAKLKAHFVYKNATFLLQFSRVFCKFHSSIIRLDKFFFFFFRQKIVFYSSKTVFRGGHNCYYPSQTKSSLAYLEPKILMVIDKEILFISM